MTREELLREGTHNLEKAGIEEAYLDARYLLFEAFHTDMTHFLLDRGRKADDENTVEGAAAAYREMIKRRMERIPLSYIVHSRAFMGLDFYVDERVLIPRQDTETLVEWVLADFKGRDPRLLDLCTGSGCIGISLASLGGFSDVLLADVSREALCVAERNCREILGEKAGKVKLVESDLFAAFESGEEQGADEWNGAYLSDASGGMEGVSSESEPVPECTLERFGVIVSNPPYIPSEVIEGLLPEVRDYEPRLALDGSGDGLCFYKKIAVQGIRHLTPGGSLYLEIGYDQAEAVSGLLRRAGYTSITVKKDAAGLDRVVKAVAGSVV